VNDFENENLVEVAKFLTLSFDRPEIIVTRLVVLFHINIIMS
jgi:hypothetical protein